MTHLRKQMLDYMSSKKFSKSYIDFYISCIAKLAKFYSKSPDKLSYDEVQEHLLFLQNQKNLSRVDYNNALSAIQFFNFSIMNFLKIKHLILTYQT